MSSDKYVDFDLLYFFQSHNIIAGDFRTTFSFTPVKPIRDVADCILKIILDTKMVDINIKCYYIRHVITLFWAYS